MSDHENAPSSEDKPDTPADKSEEKSETQAKNPEGLEIKVQDDKQISMVFKLKWHTKMSKVMDAWCKAQGVVLDTRRFFLDNHRIVADDTPEGLEMVNGDVIDVHMQQLGGYAGC